MTNEQALEQLKINGTKEPLEISGSPTRMANYFKALDIASKALEKQIAKKPRINRVSDDTEYMKCPQCRLTTALYSNMRPDYCPKCGQKLDLE